MDDWRNNVLEMNIGLWKGTDFHALKHVLISL